MQFSLKSLFIVVTLAGVAICLVVTAPTRAAIPISVLLVGVSFTVFARKQFPRSSKTVGVGTALLFLYFWSDGLLIALQPVVLREATPDDILRDNYFCIELLPDMTTRNIIVAEGTFSRDTWLTGVLYIVQSGTVRELNGFTVGRSPNSLGAPEWLEMKMTMALADAKKSKGRVTQLGVVGETRGGGNGGCELVHQINVTATKTLPGIMVRGQMEIVYVEGDHEAKVTPTMSIADFAKANSGNFLVVVSGLER